MSELQEYYVNANITSQATEYARQLKEILKSKANITWNKDLFIVSTYSNKLAKYNGTIFEVPLNFKSEPKLVAYSFNYIEDYNPKEHKELLTNNWNEFKVEPIIDGSIMRLYYYSGTWHIATQNNVDASKVNWSSTENFAMLFREAMEQVELEYSMLNENYCYTFILQSPKNHMIINYDVPNLVLLCITEGFNDITNTAMNLPCDCVETLTEFKSFEEVLTKCNEDQTPPLNLNSNLGYILTHNTSGLKIRLETTIYHHAKELKGNVPNILYRILQVLHNKQNDEFLMYFPQYTLQLEQLKHKVYKISNNLYSDFLNTKGPRYSNNLWNHIVNEIYYINKDEGKISAHRIQKYLYQLDPNRLRLLCHINYYVNNN